MRNIYYNLPAMQHQLATLKTLQKRVGAIAESLEETHKAFVMDTEAGQKLKNALAERAARLEDLRRHTAFLAGALSQVIGIYQMADVKVTENLSALWRPVTVGAGLAGGLFAGPVSFGRPAATRVKDVYTPGWLEELTWAARGE